MKYAFAFLLLGGALAYWSLALEGAGLLLLWPSASFLVVATGYAGIGARVFGKRSDGSVSAWARLLHAPFRLYAGAVWHLTRIIAREPAFGRVSGDLLIGRRLLPVEVPDGLDNYVDLTAEFADPISVRRSQGYRCLPVLDGNVPPAAGFLSLVAEVSTGTTFVHCAQGHGRTGLFALALLAARGNARSYEDALALVRNARPGVRLNRVQETFARNMIARLQRGTTQDT